MFLKVKLEFKTFCFGSLLWNLEIFLFISKVSSQVVWINSTTNFLFEEANPDKPFQISCYSKELDFENCKWFWNGNVRKQDLEITTKGPECVITAKESFEKYAGAWSCMFIYETNSLQSQTMEVFWIPKTIDVTLNAERAGDSELELICTTGTLSPQMRFSFLLGDQIVNEQIGNTTAMKTIIPWNESEEQFAKCKVELLNFNGLDLLDSRGKPVNGLSKPVIIPYENSSIDCLENETKISIFSYPHPEVVTIKFLHHNKDLTFECSDEEMCTEIENNSDLQVSWNKDSGNIQKAIIKVHTNCHHSYKLKLNREKDLESICEAPRGNNQDCQDPKGKDRQHEGKHTETDYESTEENNPEDKANSLKMGLGQVIGGSIAVLVVLVVLAVIIYWKSDQLKKLRQRGIFYVPNVPNDSNIPLKNGSNY